MDDALDWSLGWPGISQFLYPYQNLAEGHHGIEAANGELGFDALPRLCPMLD